ncbi:MAG: hypothetical protein PHY94_05780 [Candidatus Omnitrophica bacterium]|nr:hypothetical protein [Candidatus Omnitrophota bacterium]
MREEKKNQYRVITFLNRQELDFLDELEKDIFFSHGIHIPRVKLIEEIIDAFKEKGALNKQRVEEELIKMYKEIKEKK